MIKAFLFLFLSKLLERNSIPGGGDWEEVGSEFTRRGDAGSVSSISHQKRQRAEGRAEDDLEGMRTGSWLEKKSPGRFR